MTNFRTPIKIMKFATQCIKNTQTTIFLTLMYINTNLSFMRHHHKWSLSTCIKCIELLVPHFIWILKMQHMIIYWLIIEQLRKNICKQHSLNFTGQDRLARSGHGFWNFSRVSKNTACVGQGTVSRFIFQILWRNLRRCIWTKLLKKVSG